MDNVGRREHADTHGPHGTKLSLLPLVALIFYEVSGGPYGVEDAVKNGGPLLAILGFIVFALIWSIPEALVTAELATAFPENGGYVVWISAAYGPFWGFQEGWWKWLSGVIDNSLYPVLFLDYIKSQVPMVAEGPMRIISLLLITALLTYLNYRGLTIVGSTAMLLTVFGLLPFVIMSVLSVPKIKPIRWLKCDLSTVQWRGYFNTLFWNLNYWDSVSTLAGEVHKPRKTFPRALFLALLLVLASYLIPLLAGTGAIDFSHDQWNDGFFAELGMIIGGKWLFWWIAMAAALSNMGLFVAEMSSDSFQLLGMAERGMLPEIFTYRSKYGTPTFGILCSASGILLLSWMSFEEIVEFLNFLYCLGMILEFGAFLHLRYFQPNLERPFMIPLGSAGVTLMCLPPTLLVILVMILASKKTVIVSACIGVLGLVAYPILMHAKKMEWLTFAVDSSLPDVPKLEELHENVTEVEHEPEFELGGEEGEEEQEEEEDSLLFVKERQGRRSSSFQENPL